MDRADIELRPLVLAFAEQMELALRRNDHKTGWRECKPAWLRDKLHEELDELTWELGIMNLSDPYLVAGDHFERLTHEAADLANIAMMAADNYGNLDVVHDGRGREVER